MKGWRFAIGAIAAVVLGALLLQGPATGAPSPAARRGVNPAEFVRFVTNPFLPFRPGTVLTYRGVKDGEVQVERVTVLHGTKRILGVRTTVVLDVSRDAGHLLERTHDWYAQDKHGNVWYFGEATTAYGPNGQQSTEGSWEAGVHGAVPGIVMRAHPRVPVGYRQEYWKGHAEDTAWILHRGGSVRVPFGHLHDVLLTLEWTRLEPSVIDRKYYAKGIGIVREASATGPNETSELVSVHRP